ncbi:hypothetical protein EON65_51460 [archaeon]|nr:MAG: hypothetical protein EON65_51460 [archaeon]
MPQSDEQLLKQLIAAFLRLTTGNSLIGIVSPDFHLVLPMGQTANQTDLETAASSSPFELLDVGDITISSARDMAHTTFLAKDPADQSLVSIYTMIFGKNKDGRWVIVHAQKSLAFPL